MLIIGLTGGIASGKSLVARVFKDLGAHLIDADAIVHELLEPDQQAWKAVLDHFGSGVLLPNRTIDRRRLGELVFSDRNEREWLNQCLHPKVFEVYSARVRHLCDRQPDCIVVLDAALLIETGYHHRMDKVIVVYAEEGQQLQRLMDRDGFSREQALARIESQMPLQEKKAEADYVIDNTGNREETERQARQIFAQCRHDGESAP
ncbi:MAG: dephospho-CoA kinase [Nitrospirae bacterium GWD2_57_9]|nr:MAG: dephospho-CoA kinase [Nitrospirae bacterium GWD2_57_9]OGW50442.1 MAG: dephospho-CoA kinase [Nitrospirae bacterium GWC2_57_9]